MSFPQFGYSYSASSQVTVSVLYSFLFPTIDSKICKEEKELQLSDLEDLDEEERLKVEDELKDGLLIGRALTESEKNSSTGSSASHFHAFSCAKQRSPITGDFLGQKENNTTGSPATQGQLYETPEKPRIWSLAHTAGANMIVGSASHPAPRTESPDCLVLRERCSGTDGQCNLARTQPIHDKALEELPPSAKILKSSTFNLQSIALNYASYPMLGETCQYATGAEGFRRSIRAAQSSLDLSDVCLSQHKEKTENSFRPVLKR
ncbi:LOW QUALITY PROTEIN: iroquois-class homeodomain protein IRX-6 [Vipera latastei]